MFNNMTGFAPINGARIYYETAGEGEPFVMIHAGVADSRQWDNEFEHFADLFRVIRYDLRGYGKSDAVEGTFSHLADLTALLNYLQIQPPIIAMGCSMGGGLAMDLALENPSAVNALIMVGSGPSGLSLNVTEHPAEAEAEKAYEAGELEKVAELETQIWFDGMNRTPEQVDPKLRKQVTEMIMIGLVNEAKKLGKRVPGAKVPAAQRLNELNVPVLVIVGENDIPYINAAADYMIEHIPTAHKVIIPDAAHLPNMEHPREFQQIVTDFLDGLKI